MDQSARDLALERLLRCLDQRNYDFVTVTPATHSNNLDRRRGEYAGDLRDALGWSLPFPPGTFDLEVEKSLRDAKLLIETAGILRSLVRVSRVHGDLFVHSSYPTDAPDAVFLGPDSYRFADLVRAQLDDLKGRSWDQPPVILDVGTGSGVGAIIAARSVPEARVVVTDINPVALTYARVNARVAGVTVEARCGDVLAGYSGVIDIAIANPPYIIDPDSRLYRDGGSNHGAQVSIDMTEAVLPRLSKVGRFILYSGSAIVAGIDAMKAKLEMVARVNGCRLQYRELDPDVFGEELNSPAYREVERIALVAAIFSR